MRPGPAGRWRRTAGDPVSPITSLDDILQTVLNSQGLSDQLHAALLAGNPLYDQCLLRPCVLGVCTCIATARVDYRDRELRGPNTSQLTLVNGGLRARVRLENLGVRLRVGGTISTDAWVRFRSVDVDVVFDLIGTLRVGDLARIGTAMPRVETEIGPHRAG